MKGQTQATSFTVFKTAGKRRFHKLFPDTAISALVLVPFNKMITLEDLRESETFVAVRKFKGKRVFL